MVSYILVMLGGALGTGARSWMSGFIAERAGEFFPLGTLVVNVSGSFVVGFFAAFTGSEGPLLVSPRFRQFFMDELSAAATLVPRVKRAVQSLTIPECRELVEETLKLNTASEILERCLQLADSRYGDLLG